VGSPTRVGIWIGGYRYGHPFVTADVTQEALFGLRREALELHRDELRSMANHLIVYLKGRSAPAALDVRSQELVASLGEWGLVLAKRHHDEPWDAFCQPLVEWVLHDMMPVLVLCWKTPR
jgi:phosphoenolpyruvate carboxylase